MPLRENATSGNPFYKVVVKEEPPFVIARKSGSDGKTTFSGLSIELLDAVSKYVGFDYNLNLVQHRSYGYRSQHGKWEGLISEIQRGTAHIAVGPIPRASKEDGNSIVDFTKPYMDTKVNLLVKYPPDEERGVSLMFQPFKAEVWVMLCLAFIAVSLALFLIGRFSPFEWAKRQGHGQTTSKDKECRNNRKMFELKNSFFFAASTISLQGYKEAPRSTAGRLLSCMWFMFSLCILLAYTASLGSILVSRSNTPRGLPFSGYEDLIDGKHVTLGGVKNDYVYSTLKASKVVNHGLLPKLFSYIDDKHEWIANAKEGIQRVQDWGGKYALVMETVKAEYVSRSRCDLMAYGESLFHLSYCFAVAKNYPIRERINTGISDLIRNGFVKRLEEKYLGKGACPVRDTGKIASLSIRPDLPVMSATSLDMKDLAMPFLFLFLGILGSGAVLAGEIYYKKKMASGKKDPKDEKEREPLNTGTKIVRAPRSSPPPCPVIVKVNNKLQEEKLSKKTDAPPKGNSPSSIEVVIVDEKGIQEEEVKDKDKNDELEKLENTEITPNNTEEIVENEDQRDQR